jgi:high-affinity iron transporter
MDALVITFREGIEAVLVIGIMVAFLRKSGRGELVRPIFYGAGTAIAFSIGLAVVLQAIGVAADNPVVEGVLFAVAAVAVVTMVVWMVRTGRRMQAGIESRVGGMLGKGRSARALAVALFAFAFFMVAREGVEMVLFLFALAIGRTSDTALLIGAAAGLVLAIGYGFLFLRGSARIDLRLFFTLTAGVLGLLSLKLVGSSIHEFEEAGLIPMSPAMAQVFDWIANSTVLDWLFVIGLSVPLITPWLRRPRPGGPKPA